MYSVEIYNKENGTKTVSNFDTWQSAYNYYGVMVSANRIPFSPGHYSDTAKNLCAQDDLLRISLTINHTESKLTDEQQDIVMKSLRAKFDDRMTMADNCLLICETAVALGLPDDFCRELFSDLLDTWPQMKEYIQSIYN